MEIPFQITVPQDQIWQAVDRNVFGAWIQSNNDEANEFANNNYQLFSNCNKSLPLRFMNDNLPNQVPTSDITFWNPIFHRSTLKNTHVIETVDMFYKEHMQDTSRTCAILSGDWQVWIKLWNMVLSDKLKYGWMIPVPGEWHWTWHIIKAIYKLFYHTILLPFSQYIGFSSLDEEAVNFHYAEDFLTLVTLAVQQWISACLEAYRQRHNNFNPVLVTNWLHSIRKNKPVYELAYACIHYFIPYWQTRAAIKSNRADQMETWWRYWIHLFMATGKTNYSVMSIRFLWELHALHPTVKECYDLHRVVSLSGNKNSGLAYDHLNELVLMGIYIYYMLMLMIGEQVCKADEQITTNRTQNFLDKLGS